MMTETDTELLKDLRTDYATPYKEASPFECMHVYEQERQLAANLIDRQTAYITARDAEIARLREAGQKLAINANLLLQNQEGCAANHYGNDIELFGMPGWLVQCRQEISEARAALETTPAARIEPQEGK